MEQSDLLRLAGIQPEITPQEKPCSNDVKYCLMSVIEYYNCESEKYHAVNLSNVYRELITQIDDLIGYVVRKCDEQARQKFNSLDDKVKNDICRMDQDGCCKKYFCCDDKPTSIAIAFDVAPVKESKDIISLDDTMCCDKPEKIESVKVPADIISDIKTAIKEFNDGEHYSYTSHADSEDSPTGYERILNALSVLLQYLTDANPESINNATTFLTGLDSDTKYKIPTSVWKYLTADYYHGDSLKTKMREVSAEFLKR